MTDDRDRVAGVAALAVMELLLAELVEKEVLTAEARDLIFADAADAFRTAAEEDGNATAADAAKLLERVQVGSDGVRAP